MRSSLVRRTLVTALAATIMTTFGIAAAAPNATNGDIVGVETTTIAGLGVPFPVNAWEIHYRSTDSAGMPVIDAAMVMVPRLPWLGPGDRPLVSYQEAEDSLGPQCAPSAVLAAGRAIGLGQTTLELPMMAAMLMRGWAIVVPDHEGPQSRFDDRGLAAHAVLDGIRAALRSPAGLGPQTPLAAYGYSGGALATTWAAEEQAGYAPDLHFAGIVTGGTPYRMLDLVAADNAGPRAALGALVLLAMVRDHPEANLMPLLNARGQAALAQDGGSCSEDLAPRYAGHNLNELTTQPNVWTTPQLHNIADRQEPGQRVPAAPILNFHSTADDAVPVANSDALVAKYCAAGATIATIRTTVPLHDLAPLIAMPQYLSFLTDRFAGLPAPTSC